MAAFSYFLLILTGLVNLSLMKQTKAEAKANGTYAPPEPLPTYAKWLVAFVMAIGTAVLLKPWSETLQGIVALSAGFFFIAGLASFLNSLIPSRKPPEEPWLTYDVFRTLTSPHIEAVRPAPKKPRLTLQEHLVCLKELSKV